MKKQTISVLLLLVAFVSCRERETYRMSHKQLKDVVRDMYLIDVAVNAHPKEYRDSISQEYMKQLTKIHNVSRSDIEHDLDLLKNDFNLLDSLYHQIEEEAEDMLIINRGEKDNNEKLPKELR